MLGLNVALEAFRTASLLLTIAAKILLVAIPRETLLLQPKLPLLELPLLELLLLELLPLVLLLGLQWIPVERLRPSLG